MIGIPIIAGDDRDLIARRLSAVAEGLVQLNLLEMDLRSYPRLYQSGLRYQREIQGREHWLSAPTLMILGVGDCEDLSGYRTAELRRDGEMATVLIYPTGGRGYHAIVKRADGSTEDPSEILIRMARGEVPGRKKRKHAV